MTFWRRPLHAMTDAFTAAGFRINVISEPPPSPDARELFPDLFAKSPRAPSCASWPTDAISGHVCLSNDGPEAAVVDMAVPPDQVAADHAALLLMARRLLKIVLGGLSCPGPGGPSRYVVAGVSCQMLLVRVSPRKRRSPRTVPCMTSAEIASPARQYRTAGAEIGAMSYACELSQ